MEGNKKQQGEAIPPIAFFLKKKDGNKKTKNNFNGRSRTLFKISWLWGANKGDLNLVGSQV